MNITFLGTGTSHGIPVVGCTCNVCSSADFRDNRMRSSVLIKENNTTFAIDCGPDFRHQMLKNRIYSLDAILFTHEHRDHTSGIDDIRGYNFALNRPMDIYAHARVIKYFESSYQYIFTDKKYPGVPQIELFEIDINRFKINDLHIIPIEVMHHKLPVFGYRIGNFTYITDANYISEAEEQKIIGSEVIVINGLQHDYHIAHYTFAEALALIHKWKPRLAYITHISHKLGMHREVEEKLPAWIRLAYDGLSFEI
ncbi:MAG: MBL fold metallo-hydrolase [Cytophagales bacterium]|nr:MBL fold metallo-hydrolase [Cytophagales bacterium]